MISWLDSMVQIIKHFASLPAKTEPYGSQHNKDPHQRWSECNVPSSAVVQIFGHKGLQINYNVFSFAFSVDKKTKRPFQNPLCLCLRFLFWDSLYGTQHISENSFEKEKKKKGWQRSTWYRHLLADTQNWTKGKTSSLFFILK